jgi:hypothetical protein
MTTNVELTYPDVPDEKLAFDEDETRRVLKFFCPSRSAQIDTMTIGNNARRLAQQAMIMALDASYAMGYLDIVFGGVKEVVTSDKLGGIDIKGLAKKLGKQAVKYWWKHYKGKSENISLKAKIYDTVKTTVGSSIVRPLDEMISGTAEARYMSKTPLLIAKRGVSGKVWV